MNIKDHCLENQSYQHMYIDSPYETLTNPYDCTMSPHCNLHRPYIVFRGAGRLPKLLCVFDLFGAGLILPCKLERAYAACLALHSPLKCPE